MIKYLVPLCLAGLLLSGTIFLAACGSDVASNSGTVTTPVSPSVTPGLPTNPQAPHKATSPVGYVDRANCEVIQGWVFDRDHPDQVLSVEIYAADKVQGTLNADQFRSDLLEGKIGTGKYGFTYPIPVNLKDGQPHPIKVKVAGAQYEPEFFQNTPRSITCMP